MVSFFATTPEDIDQSMVDYWSLVHWMSGVTLNSVFRLDKRVVFSLAVIWEIIENSSMGTYIWESVGDNTYHGDSNINILTDILFVMLGFYSVR